MADKELRMIETKLYNQSYDRLGFKTLNEAFKHSFSHAVVISV